MPESPAAQGLSKNSADAKPLSILTIPQPPDLDDIESEQTIDHATLAEFREVAESAARTSFGLRPYTFNLKQAVPPWLIDGFLQERAIHVISAAKGSCKTWLGLNILLCGRYGLPLLGHPAQHFNTIYVAADSPLWDIRRQLRLMIEGYGLTPDKQATSFICPLGFRLDEKSHLTALAQVVQTWNIKCLILDVFLYSHVAAENDDREMSEIMKLVKYLRDNLGLAIVLVHHHGKTRGDARGAGTILQASEHHYELRRKDGGINLHREKVRGEEDWTDIRFNLTAGPSGGKILSVTEPAPSAQSAPAQNSSILSALASGPQPVSVLRTFASSPKALDNELQKLRREGLVVSQKRGIWQLTGS